MEVRINFWDGPLLLTDEMTSDGLFEGATAASTAASKAKWRWPPQQAMATRRSPTFRTLRATALGFAPGVCFSRCDSALRPMPRKNHR